MAFCKFTKNKKPVSKKRGLVRLYGINFDEAGNVIEVKALDISQKEVDAIEWYSFADL